MNGYFFLVCTFFPSEYNLAAHLQNVRVVVHLPLEAAFSRRGGTLGEVAALVEKEKSFAILFLQTLQFSTVLPVDGCL